MNYPKTRLEEFIRSNLEDVVFGFLLLIVAVEAGLGFAAYWYFVL